MLRTHRSPCYPFCSRRLSAAPSEYLPQWKGDQVDGFYALIVDITQRVAGSSQALAALKSLDVAFKLTAAEWQRRGWTAHQNAGALSAG